MCTNFEVGILLDCKDSEEDDYYQQNYTSQKYRISNRLVFILSGFLFTTD